jgi:hypothetical protein
MYTASATYSLFSLNLMYSHIKKTYATSHV